MVATFLTMEEVGGLLERLGDGLDNILEEMQEEEDRMSLTTEDEETEGSEVMISSKISLFILKID